MHVFTRFTLAAALLAAGVGGGWLAARHLPPSLATGDTGAAAPEGSGEGERKVLFYRNPMNPAITSPTFTKDEMGMDYIPVYEGEEAQNGRVTVAPETAQNLGLRSARVERAELARRVETVGYVDYDERRISHVHLRTPGWIERLAVRSLGDPVKRGQLLFELYSPELVYAQQEYLQSLETGNRRLAAGGRDKLLALGVSPELADALAKGGAIRQRVQIFARQDGTVSELNVREGMYVKPENVVMAIADLASVWVLAEVFERQAEWMRPGLAAEVRFPYLGGEPWHGTLEYVYPVLDPVTRTLRVRLRFDNPGEALKPNMYAEVNILAEPREGLAIPREALIRTGEGARVIVDRGDGFEAVVVTPGIESGERVEILEGLEEGEVVITSAQFLIDSEASLKASIARMTRAERAEPRRSAEAIGEVHGVEGRTLNMTHEPIPDLGWPAMTMDFELAEGLAAPEPGSRVRFTVAEMGDYPQGRGVSRDPQGAGPWYRYVVTAIEPMEGESAAPPAAPTTSHAHHQHQHAPAAAEPVRADGVGILHRIDPQARSVNLTHEPIAAVGWPTMTMDFQVEPGIDLSHLRPDQPVAFTMEERENYQYVLVRLEPRP